MYGYKVMLVLVYAKCLVLFYMEFFSVVILFEEKGMYLTWMQTCVFILQRPKVKEA